MTKQKKPSRNVERDTITVVADIIFVLLIALASLTCFICASASSSELGVWLWGIPGLTLGALLAWHACRSRKS